MNEAELRALFEREYCEEVYHTYTPQEKGISDLDKYGNYIIERVFYSYRLWRRAKTEARTVKFDKNGVGDTNMYMVSDALERVNVKVEFV